MDKSGTVLEDHELAAATQPVLSKQIWVSSAWLTASLILGCLAWVMKLLKSQGVYIYFTPNTNSDTFSIALMLLAIGPLIVGINGLVQLVKNHAPNRVFLRLGKALGALIAVCGTVILLLSVLLTLPRLPTASYLLKSPHDERSVLVLNQSFLLFGAFTIYEPRTWPIYSQISWITTNDGFDPFKSGQYTETWTDAGLELEYLFDNSLPNSVHMEPVQMPK